MIRFGEVIFVALGGALGAALRLLVARLWELRISSSTFPIGTLSVNVAGCFLIGILAGFSNRVAISDELRLFLITGVLGGFTTFSAFGFESVVLFKNGETTAAILYAAGSVIAGCGAVVVGLYASGFRGIPS